MMDDQDQRSEESLDCINTCCVVMTVSMDSIWISSPTPDPDDPRTGTWT